VGEVATTVETAFRGQTVSQVLEGRNAFDLVVRVGDPMDITAEAIEILPVDTPAGAKLPLKALAQILRSTGPNQVSRENVQRKIVVMCNVSGRDLKSVVGDIRRRIEAGVPLGRGQYEGYYLKYGGQFESAEETARLLTILGLAVVLAIGFLLNLSFGIATRNGIMLVSHIRHLQSVDGVSDFGEAVYRGASTLAHDAKAAYVLVVAADRMKAIAAENRAIAGRFLDVALARTRAGEGSGIWPSSRSRRRPSRSVDGALVACSARSPGGNTCPRPSSLLQANERRLNLQIDPENVSGGRRPPSTWQAGFRGCSPPTAFRLSGDLHPGRPAGTDPLNGRRPAPSSP
jgi:hypothetical protein